ncbi:MAG: MBOAT family protein [Treponema sp.]|nr:MBOAT family protein [Treponema sp.]
MLASACFYAFADLKFVPFLLYSIAVTYFAGIIIGSDSFNFDGGGYKGVQYRAVFFALVAADLLPLLFFKYAPKTWHSGIIFPLGLSFFTFQSLSYIFDCRAKKIQVEKNILDIALFVSFFPVISSGPIQRAGNLIPQLKTLHKFDYDNATCGMKQFAWGVFKKFCVADALAVYVDFVYASESLASRTGLATLLATIFYAFQIYCDFSAYSDMAIGVSRFMGFDAGKNFDHPYLATSVGDFWRRWHISLSTWLRDYIYIPLGGSRVALARIYFNLLATFLVSGIWHGSTWNFVIWGALHGVFQCIGRASKGLWEKSRLPYFVRATIVFCLVAFAWIFFRAPNLSDALAIIKNFGKIPQDIVNLFAAVKSVGLKDAVKASLAIDGGFMGMVNRCVALLIFVCLSLATRKQSGLKIVKTKSTIVRWLSYYAFAIILIWFYNTGFVSNFIYSNF